MEAVIEMANEGEGRFAVRLPRGYTVFEALGPEMLQVGDKVSGELENLGSQIIGTPSGSLEVFIDDIYCSAEEAAAWVERGEDTDLSG